MTWDQRIALAEVSGMFGIVDRALAGDWSCCAVSEQRGLPKRERTILFNELGAKFYLAVRDDDYITARMTYNEIVAAAKAEREAETAGAA